MRYIYALRVCGSSKSRVFYYIMFIHVRHDAHCTRTWYVCDAPLCLNYFSSCSHIKYYLTKVVIWRSLPHTSSSSFYFLFCFVIYCCCCFLRPINSVWRRKHDGWRGSACGDDTQKYMQCAYSRFCLVFECACQIVNTHLRMSANVRYTTTTQSLFSLSRAHSSASKWINIVRSRKKKLKQVSNAASNTTSNKIKEKINNLKTTYFTLLAWTNYLLSCTEVVVCFFSFFRFSFLRLVFFFCSLLLLLLLLFILPVVLLFDRRLSSYSLPLSCINFVCKL